MTENVIVALIICGSLVAVVGILTTVISVCAYSQELVSAWKMWRKSRED